MVHVCLLEQLLKLRLVDGTQVKEVKGVSQRKSGNAWI
jgi:hypothetical protein